MTVVGYIRSSTGKQDNSLEAQESMIRAQAALKSMELKEVIVDRDEFSGSLDRPGLQRVLEMVRAKEIDALIISKLDRLTRSTRDAIELIELFGRKKVALISVHESLDTESPMGRFVVRLMASIGELEREMIGSRTRDGLQNLKRQGYAAGPAPYGWTAPPRTDEERRLKIRKPLVRNEEEQHILGLIRRLRNEGRMSMPRIVDELNRRGLKTRSGSEWRHQYVAGILRGER